MDGPLVEFFVPGCEEASIGNNGGGCGKGWLDRCFRSNNRGTIEFADNSLVLRVKLIMCGKYGRHAVLWPPSLTLYVI